MKKSSAVMLVISGALLTSCDSSDSSSNWGDSQTYTNNHYQAGRGYYHAPYHAWYPFPYNTYHPARGYYHGGSYSAAPHVSGITASRPAAGPSSAASSRSSSSSISRGGFSSSHSSGGIS